MWAGPESSPGKLYPVMLADGGGRSETVPGTGVVEGGATSEIVPGAGIVEEVSMVTAGLITGGEYGIICVIVVGVAEGVGMRVRAC